MYGLSLYVLVVSLHGLSQKPAFGQIPRFEAELGAVSTVVRREQLLEEEAKVRTACKLALKAAEDDVAKYAECLQNLERLLAIQTQLYPASQSQDGHANIVETLTGMSTCCSWIADHQRARELAERALAMCRKVADYGPLLTLCLELVSDTNRDCGDIGKASVYLEQSAEMCELLFSAEYFPFGHPQSARIAFDKGDLLWSRGQFDSAIAQFALASATCRTYCNNYHDPGDEWAELGFYLYPLTLQRLLKVRLFRGELKEATAVCNERDLALTMVNQRQPSLLWRSEMVQNKRSLGAIFVASGDYVRAIQSFEAALGLHEQLTRDNPANRSGIGAIFGDLAATHQRSGNLVQAREFGRRALEEIRKSFPNETHPAGTVALATALNRYGAILKDLGDLDGAREHLRQSLEIRRRIASKNSGPQHKRMVAIALAEIGELYRLQGELQQSINFMEESAQILEEVFPPSSYPNGHHEVCAICQNTGSFYLDANRYEQALKWLLRSAEMWEKLASAEKNVVDKRSWAVTLDHLGETYREVGQLGKSEGYLDRAYTMFLALYPPDQYPSGHIDLVLSLTRRARLRCAQGRFAEGVEAARDALSMVRKLYPSDLFPGGHQRIADAFSEYGYALFRGNDYINSSQAFLASVRMQQAIAREILPGLSEAECVNYVRENLALPAGLITACQASPDSLGQLYGAIWERRGTVMRTICERQVLARTASSAVVARIVKDLQELNHRIAVLMRGMLTRSQVSHKYVSELAELTGFREDLERQLADAVPRYREVHERFQIRADTLSEHLPSGCAYLEFVAFTHIRTDAQASTHRYGCLVVLPGQSPSFVDLCDANAAGDAVAGFRRAIRTGTDCLEPGQAIRKLVWEEIEDVLPEQTRTIYIAADGALGAVPWCALPAENVHQYLIEKYAFAVVPCGQLLYTWLQRPAVTTATRNVLLVGDVDYSQLNLPDAKVQTGERVLYAALDGAEQEIREVHLRAKAHNVRLLTGADGSTANVLNELPRAHLAHFATHGYFVGPQFRTLVDEPSGKNAASAALQSSTAAGRNPLVLSGLVLSGANLARATDEGNHAESDGILSADAISMLNLEQLELAVLSACETGLGELAGGEGILGLQRAFHVAGTKNVIGSLWKVDDRATLALMCRFYSKLLEDTKPPLEALRESQMEICLNADLFKTSKDLRGRIEFSKTVPLGSPAAGGRAFSHPQYWAAFVLSGPGR